MTPVDQEFLHDPGNGSWGDCMRACLASILDLPIKAVPHFFDGGCDNAEFDRRVGDFLAQHGLVEVSMKADTAQRIHYTRDCYHLIYGHTERGTYHAVVGLNGMMAHDPHPSKAGIIECPETHHAFLIRTGPAHIKATQGGKEGAG